MINEARIENEMMAKSRLRDRGVTLELVPVAHRGIHIVIPRKNGLQIGKPVRSVHTIEIGEQCFPA